MSNTDTNLALWLAFLSLNEQATRDWLTGLYNRRYFEETLADHIETATRYNRELSLVLFDLDDFKQINDTHGHDAGDEALRKFADLLKESARKADIVCRHGGDEFAVILPETNLTNARQFAERILLSLEEISWRGAGLCVQGSEGAASPPIQISTTTGIAALPCENLVAAADADLLARKKGPRQ